MLLLILIFLGVICFLRRAKDYEKDFALRLLLLSLVIIYVFIVPIIYDDLYSDKVKIDVYKEQLVATKKQRPKNIGIVDKQSHKQFSLEIEISNKLIKTKKTREKNKWLGFVWTGIPYHFMN
jgi:hypothetical protein